MGRPVKLSDGSWIDSYDLCFSCKDGCMHCKSMSQRRRFGKRPCVEVRRCDSCENELTLTTQYG
jgi:hypothetical protein